jgi:3-hydroxyisobutyrate dehydrogenase-like beta-hydroxyacid dehydrogenase
MLALGERAGLARKVIVDAFTTGAFATPSYIGKKAKVLARDYRPEFTLRLAHKDCRVNVELQRELGLALPVHRACTRALASAVRAGLGDADLFALERYYAEPPPARKPAAKTTHGKATKPEKARGRAKAPSARRKRI